MTQEHEDLSAGYISDWARTELARKSPSEKGVQKSSKRFPQKGMPMGESAERGLMRLRGELWEGEPAELVITEKWFTRLLPLRPVGVKGPALPWEPRYDRITGEVCTTRTDTDPAVKITSEGKKALPDPEKYEILEMPPWRKQVDLDRIPKSWRITVVRPQRVWDGITAALRQMDEIRGDHKAGAGVEYGRVEELYIAARRLFDRYSRGEVRPESVQGIADEIFRVLQTEGVLTARHPKFEELEEIFARALLPDRRGRFNPQAKRMQLYKGLRDLTTREVQTALIARRADRVFRRLYVEWENERFSLVLAKVSMEEFRHHPIFRGKRRIFDEEITDARAVIKEIKGALSAARTAPFLLPASIAEALLVSKSLMGERGLGVLRKRLEIGGVTGVLGGGSVEDLLMQRRPQEALARLKYPHSVVVSALEDPDNFEVTVFDQ
ncbi:MAG: hypothetical protein ACOYT7_00885 [Patescibacteria group bacterium]